MPTDRLDRYVYRLRRSLVLVVVLALALASALALVSCRTTEAKPQCDVVVYGDQQPKEDYGTAVVCFRGDNGKDR